MLIYFVYIPYYICIIIPIRIFTLFVHPDAKAWMTINPNIGKLTLKQKAIKWAREFGVYFVMVPYNASLLGLLVWYIIRQIS